MVTTMATRHHNQSASRILWKLPLKSNFPLMVSFMQRGPDILTNVDWFPSTLMCIKEHLHNFSCQRVPNPFLITIYFAFFVIYNFQCVSAIRANPIGRDKRSCGSLSKYISSLMSNKSVRLGCYTIVIIRSLLNDTSE